MRTTLVGVVLLMCCANPPPGPRCDATTCRGCCDTAGVCQTGTAGDACGVSGAQCGVCGPGMACVTGLCSPSGSGGSGGAGGNGGTGGTGGATGATHDELVSGTRLRAIRYVSADGAKAQFSSVPVFWDNQLSAYCIAWGEWCYPLDVVSEFWGDDRVFNDSTCQTRAGFRVNSPGGILNGTSLPPGQAFFAESDGGYSKATAMGSAYHRTSNGQCAQIPSQTAFIPGAAVPVTDFAALTVQRD